MEDRANYNSGGDRIELPASVLLEYGDPSYTDPEPEHVREVLKRGLLTGSRAASLVGVSSRTVRKWTGGDQNISYSAWRILLHYARLIDGLPQVPLDQAVAYAPGQQPVESRY